MPVFLELKNGRRSLEPVFDAPGSLGAVLGPFLTVRLLREELRLTTQEGEFPLQRILAWIFYDGHFYADIGIVPADQMGPRRKQRWQRFDPDRAHLDTCMDT